MLTTDTLSSPRPPHARSYIRLSADDTEDIWHLYNLISAGDSVRSTTVRNNTTGSITGSTKTERSRTTLTLAVEYVECDTQADLLRVRGRNIVENPYVPLGHYHTLDVRPNMLVQIQKPEWDALALDRVREACDPAAGVDLAAVCMQDGLAHVCLIRSSLTLQRAKIEMAVPRKRRGMTEQHDKGMRKFNEAVLQAIVRHIDFAVVKCVLIASPGFVKDQFFAYLTQRATELRVLADNRDKFVLVHASSGYTTELPAVLQQPAIAERVAGTMAAGEVLALRRFYELLQTDEARAWYGKAHVLRAAQEDAIETLLISDNLFR